MAEEATVPIFTILKNGAILKNIFIVNNPSIVNHVESEDLANQEILNVGRHPDCHIELTHPSISRFHLQIFSNPSVQKLSVMDLSSAHGTWVSNERIEPGVRVELNEGDTLRVGSSSRVYRLHWIPLNQAYDLEHPFVSALDVSFLEEEEESANNEEKMIVGAHQDDLEGIEHGEVRVQEVLQEKIEEILPFEKEKVEALNVKVEEHKNELLKTEIWEFGVAEEIQVNAENEEMVSINDVEIIALYKDDLLNIDNGEFGENEDLLEQIDGDIPANAVEASEPAYQDEAMEEIYYQVEAKEGIYQIVMDQNEEFQSRDGGESNILQPKNQGSVVCLEFENFKAFDSLEHDSEMVSVNNKLPEEHQEGNGSNIYLENSAKELLNPCLSEQNILLDVTGRHLDKEDQTTEANRSSIWSRRGKPAAVLELQTGSRKSKSTGFNTENRHQIRENTENSFVIRDLFAELDREEEVFTPNKENMTPNTRKLKFMKDIGKFEGLVLKEKIASHSSDKENQTQQFNSKPLEGSNLKNFSSPVIFHEDDLVLNSLVKENQTPESTKIRRRAQPLSRNRSRLVQGTSEVHGIRERLPFQSLDVKSSESSVPKVAAERKRSCWIMVADTSCFLDKESWKSLQLLEGLRGTQLVVPRIVIRELDSMRSKFSLFQRTTKVSFVLEWIEEAMVNSEWWIHVQSSSEEGRSIAHTPTAATDWSPRFSSFDELVSPTAEDRVLDHALFVNKMKKNNSVKVVLLSNDISLKIKAMADGLLCETAQEFRDSLVSPLSDRFMWAESCPRGRTWSCSEESVLLKEKNQYMKKRDAKGLKLILLHNANYSRQINSFD